MELLDYMAVRVVVWLLVLVRVSGIFVTAPVFSNHHLPVQVRVLTAVGISFALAPLASPQTASPPAEVLPFVLLIIREGMVGLALGFVPAIIFLAVQYAAEMVDLQMGMGMGGWVDPTFRTSVSPVGNFQYLLATVMFLSLDGHHLLLEALARSFTLIPLGTFTLMAPAVGGVVRLFGQMALFGVQVAAPILSVLLITDVGLGILGRAAPQLNLLVGSPPLKVTVGLAAMATALPLLAFLLGHLFGGMSAEFYTLLRAPALGGAPYVQ